MIAPWQFMNPKWNGQFSRFDLVASTRDGVPSVVRAGDVEIGGGDFVVMAGPCAVESERQLLRTAEAVAEAGARILRGGAYKPRSSPYAFQGLGLEGLKILRKAREETGLAIVTEAMSEEDVDLVAEYADLMQVGTRSMENYALLERLGGCGRPVLLKRGMTATLEELLQSAQIIAMNGNSQIVLCERGIRTFETATRNTLDIAAVPVLKTVSHLPVIVDPSHAAGVRCLVPVLARAAAVVGADGLSGRSASVARSGHERRRAVAHLPRFPRHDGRSAALSGDSRRWPADGSATGRGGSGRLVRMRSIAVRLSSLVIMAGIVMRDHHAGIIGFAPTFSVLSSGPDSPAFLFTVAKRYEPLAWMRGADRFSSGANIFLQDANGRHPLVPAFRGFCRSRGFIRRQESVVRRQAEGRRSLADLGSCLGRNQRPAQPRRITSCADDCVRPFYLPDDRIVYAEENRWPLRD